MTRIIIIAYQQWTTAEEATENPYDHEVEEENQDEVATAWGNDEEVVQEQVCKLNSNISICDPWILNINVCSKVMTPLQPFMKPSRKVTNGRQMMMKTLTIGCKRSMRRSMKDMRTRC